MHDKDALTFCNITGVSFFFFWFIAQDCEDAGFKCIASAECTSVQIDEYQCNDGEVCCDIAT